MDVDTLDLLMLQLDEAGISWAAAPSAATNMAVLKSEAVACMLSGRPRNWPPSEECKAGYIDALLRQGALFRTPTDEERTALSERLDELIAEGGGFEARDDALLTLAKSALLMTGALFRSEVGSGRAEPSPLSAEELILALGSVIDTHPVSSSHRDDVAFTEGYPDAEDPAAGYLQALRAAATDEAERSIFNPEVRRSLLRSYGSGVASRGPHPESTTNQEPLRPDLRDDGGAASNRGEYWLAPRIMGFFREWLDYESADTAFKDDPGATSQWETSSSFFDQTAKGFRRVQNAIGEGEGTLSRQLDDTIARAVVEAEEPGIDVFEHLLTTRHWRLPSNRSLVSDRECTERTDCAFVCDTDDGDPIWCPLGETDYTDANEAGLCVNSRGEPAPGSPTTEQGCPSFPVCNASAGRCIVRVAKATPDIARVYGFGDGDDIPAYPDGRWVMMPEGERLGVLTHPAWLGAHGGNFQDDMSLVFRGLWVRERLFCSPVGHAPAGVVAELVEREEGQTARERWRVTEERNVVRRAEDSSIPTCAGCHSLMNPLGLPFEHFNHAGFVRDRDSDGEPPDSSTMVPEGYSPDPTLVGSYSDFGEFIRALAASPRARQSFVRHAFRYFMGRDEVYEDSCTLAEMGAALDDTGSFFAMLEALVSSETFTHRSLPAVGGES